MITKYEQEAARIYPRNGGRQDEYAGYAQAAFIKGAEFAAPKWISVTERVPDEWEGTGYSKDVFIYEDGVVRLGCYDHERKMWRKYGYVSYPSHWMPLPDPPNT